MKVDQEKLQQYLQKITPPECPLCQQRRWSVNDTIFQLLEFQNGDLIIGGGQSIFPVIPLTCDNCGNVHFINAIKAGLIEPNKNGDGVKNG